MRPVRSKNACTQWRSTDLVTREQAQELIHEIPSIRAEICTERNPTTLRVHYEASLQSHECRRLISLIKGIRRKGEETEKKGRNARNED